MFSIKASWFYWIIFLLFCAFDISAQDVRRDIRHADRLFENGDFKGAVLEYRKVLMVENDLNVKENLAHSYRKIGDFSKAEYWYRKVLKEAPQRRYNELYLAKVLQGNEKYKEAAAWFNKHADIDPSASTWAKICTNISGKGHIQSDVEIRHLNINTAGVEYGPVLHQNALVFAASPLPKNISGKEAFNYELAYNDLYSAQKRGRSGFQSPKIFQKKLNSFLNDGPVTFNKRKGEMWITKNSSTATKQSGGKRVLELHYSYKDDKGKWTKPVAFQYNDPAYSVGHAALSKDGELLFFISDQPQGYGGTDIYYSERRDTFWTAPKNLGTAINTSEDEMFPFVDDFGNLYFASEGHPGYGGFDLFESHFKNGKWSTPKNLEPPINSSKDDISIFYLKNGKEGYFASNRNGGKGMDDIYSFSQSTGRTYQSSQIEELRSEESPEVVFETEETVVIREPEVSNPVDSRDQRNKDRPQDKPRNKPEDKTIQTPKVTYQPPAESLNAQLGLKEMQYKDKRSDLSRASKNVLQKIITHLRSQTHQGLLVEVHTDSRGKKKDNLELSNERSLRIKNYLVAQGISGDRIKMRGHGESRTVVDCKKSDCTDNEHRINQRVIFSNFDLSRVETTTPQAETPHPPKTSEPAVNSESTSTAPVQVAMPVVTTTDRKEGFVYEVRIGPYDPVHPILEKNIQNLQLQAVRITTKRGEIFRLGMFPTIKEAEAVRRYIKTGGFEKVKVIVFENGQETNQKVEKLKRRGYE